MDDPVDTALEQLKAVPHRRARRHRGRNTVGPLLLALLLIGVFALIRVLPTWSPEAVPSPTVSCPDPTQAPNKAEMPGWVAMVVWDGRDYLLTEQQGTPGERLGAVTCDIVAINKRTRAVPPRPWPDGSSTAAAVGSPIHAHQGRDTACELVLDTPEWGWRVFRAADC